MSYEFTESEGFASYLRITAWSEEVLKNKIDEIKKLANPKFQGGEYRNKWAYQAGKLHIIADIDDTNKKVVFIKVIKLP